MRFGGKYNNLNLNNQYQFYWSFTSFYFVQFASLGLLKNCVKFIAQCAALNSKFALFLNKILHEILALFIYFSSLN